MCVAFRLHEEKTMLSVGSDAPDFSAQDQDANTVTRSGLSGKWIAMWWYLKASTPG